MDVVRDRIKRVRARLAVRAILSASVSTAIVIGAAVLVASIAFPMLPRWPWALALALGPSFGMLAARRGRPSDEEVVLYLDRRLGAGEALVTAWELGDDVPPLLRATVARAHAMLREADPREMLPRARSAQLAWLAPAALFAAIGAVIPVRSASGSDDGRVVISNAEALRRIERLAEEERDPARRRQLDAAARPARELARALREGLDRDEGREQLETIRREVEAARRPETREERRARDAAMDQLAGEPEMQRARAERDSFALDRAVERAAARREAADRRRAQEALDRAAAAARQSGDAELAESLERRSRVLRRRAEQAALARELAEALPELQGMEVRRQLDRLEREGDGSQLSRAMVDAMREAWSRLTPEEREQLARAMQRASAAESTEAQAQREESARPLDADEMERQLRDALEHLDRLELAVGAGGIPIAGPGASSSGEGNGEGDNGEGGGDGRGEQGGSGGPGGGGGPGHEGGDTAPVRANDGPLARVRPELGPGAPSQTTFESTDPTGMPLPEGTPDGEAASAAAPGEPGAIERSAIPEDYRDHVRTYFGGETR